MRKSRQTSHLAANRCRSQSRRRQKHAICCRISAKAPHFLGSWCSPFPHVHFACEQSKSSKKTMVRKSKCTNVTWKLILGCRKAFKLLKYLKLLVWTSDSCWTLSENWLDFRDRYSMILILDFSILLWNSHLDTLSHLQKHKDHKVRSKCRRCVFSGWLCRSSRAWAAHGSHLNAVHLAWS